MFYRLFTKLPAHTLRNNLVYRAPLYSFCNNQQNQLQQEVQAKIFEILKSAAKCDQTKLTKKATFQELGFDSLDSVELVVAMQENLGLDIPNEQAEKISTVEAAINTFYRHLNQKMNNPDQNK